MVSLYHYVDSRQIERLIYADWKDPYAAIHVRADLSLADAERSILFRNARTLFNALDESGGTKATEAGNLNRKFVAEMMEQLDLTPHTLEVIRAVNKVINEQTVWDLHLTRIIVELAGLIRRSGGNFQVVQKRSHLMEDEHAGVLYSLLFRTFFREFNLSYLDGMADAPFIQQAVAVSLFMISRLMNRWEFVEDIAPALFLEQVQMQIPVSFYSDHTGIMAYSRILRPLLQFGLLEKREQEGSWREIQLRKTDLFDRVLQFNVKVSSSSGYLH